MPSTRATGKSVDEAVLIEAARSLFADVGWSRTTITDVARRAGVSRMTVYRRWPDMQRLSAAVMSREFATLGSSGAFSSSTITPAIIGREVARCIAQIRSNPVFVKIITVDPELLIPYLLERRGHTQDTLLDVLTQAITAGQATGNVRDGDPRLLARTVLLSTYGCAYSTATMTDAPKVNERALLRELTTMIAAYLS